MDDVSFRDWHFWVFDVADSAITVGVGLMIIGLLWSGTRSHVSKTV